jgi:hypothetical protein
VKTADGWTVTAAAAAQQLLTRRNGPSVCYQVVAVQSTNVSSAHRSFSCAGPERFTVAPQFALGSDGLTVYGVASPSVTQIVIRLQHTAARAEVVAQGFLVVVPQMGRADVVSVDALAADGHLLGSLSGSALPPGG